MAFEMQHINKQHC